MQPFPSQFARPLLPSHRPQLGLPPTSHPVRQRSSTTMPNPRGPAATNPYAPRRVPVAPSPQGVNEESQLDFPYPQPPPPRPASSRPPSAFAPSQLPSSQFEHQGRETSFAPLESSYGESLNEHGHHVYPPMSASQAVVDHYQPPRSGVSNGTSRGGAQVYQTAREPKTQKAQEILTNLAGEYSSLLSCMPWSHAD